MKKLIIFLALTSCMSTEVIGYEPGQIVVTDTTTKKPHKPLPPRDTTSVTDTSRVPIDWNPSVADWEDEQDIDM